MTLPNISRRQGMRAERKTQQSGPKTNLSEVERWAAKSETLEYFKFPVYSTYSCKQLFSQMNVVKNKLRNRVKTTWCVSYEQVSTAALRVL